MTKHAVQCELGELARFRIDDNRTIVIYPLLCDNKVRLGVSRQIEYGLDDEW